MGVKIPGYEQYTEDDTLNFMLNRLAWDIDDNQLKEIGKRVSTLENFVEVMLVEAQDSEEKGLLINSAFYYRAAEFFMPETHKLKGFSYEKFMTYFYQETPNVAMQRCLVDFESGKLGVIDIPAVGETKDVILLFSGFDGLIEELYSCGLTLASSGYRVILFEGPGQGSALRRYNMPMIFNWESPVSAILDHFNLDSCTLAGVSLGGYLAPRAAAFEPRVKRVIAWGAMQDWTGVIKSSMGGGVKSELVFKLVNVGCKRLINRFTYKIAAKDPKVEWGLHHGLHASGKNCPFDFLKFTMDFTLNDVAKDITQDALLIMGESDHLVPAHQLQDQSNALINAKSVTTRWVTEKEHGAEHCQIGNPDLVVNQILLWLDGLNLRDQAEPTKSISY